MRPGRATPGRRRAGVSRSAPARAGAFAFHGRSPGSAERSDASRSRAPSSRNSSKRVRHDHERRVELLEHVAVVVRQHARELSRSCATKSRSMRLCPPMTVVSSKARARAARSGAGSSSVHVAAGTRRGAPRSRSRRRAVCQNEPPRRGTLDRASTRLSSIASGLIGLCRRVETCGQRTAQRGRAARCARQSDERRRRPDPLRAPRHDRGHVRLPPPLLRSRLRLSRLR